MKNTLNNPQVKNKLDELHNLATAQKEHDYDRLSKAQRYMAVSPDQGSFLNFLATLNHAQHIVEFGCSFGISGIYLAAAAKDNDGSVITTELEAAKAEIARQNFEAAGVGEFIKVFTGDALQTLKNIEKVDFLFLDGAKELYLPVFELLYPQLSATAIVVADNMYNPETHNLADRLLSTGEFKIVTLFDGRMLAAYRKI